MQHLGLNEFVTWSNIPVQYVETQLRIGGKTVTVLSQDLLIHGNNVRRIYNIDQPLVEVSVTVSLPELLRDISKGPATLDRLDERFHVFNDVAMELNIPEIREDMQKLLADCQLLVEQLPENEVANSIAKFGISWTTLYCAIEKHVMENTYDMVYFKICQLNQNKNLNLSEIISQCSNISIGSLALDFSLANQEFSKIEILRTPMEKMDCLISTVDILSTAVTFNSSAVLNGDMMISLLITCVARSKVLNLWSNLDYIKLFTFEKEIETGKTGYVISTFEAALQYLALNSDLLIENSKICKLIEEAIQKNDKNQLLRLFEKVKTSGHSDVFAHFVDGQGKTALGLATSLNNSEMVSLLIDFGMSVDQQDSRGNTPLHICAALNHHQIAQILLDSGCDILRVNKAGQTAFDSSISHDNQKLSDLILKRNPLLTQASKSSRILFLCKSVNMLGFLKTNFALDLETAYEKQTFVHYCAKNNYIDLLKAFFALLEPSSIPKIVNQSDANRKTPLHVAAENLNSELFELLLKAGGNQYYRDITGKTCTDIESMKHRDTLLDACLIQKYKTTGGRTAVNDAFARGHNLFEIRTLKGDELFACTRSLEEFEFFDSQVNFRLTSS